MHATNGNAKREKELQRLYKLKNKPVGKYFPVVVFFLVVMIHIIDEITTNIGGYVQSSVVTEFFVVGQGMTFEEGLSVVTGGSMIMVAIQILGTFYKSLSDRWGRKPFLVINTCGMGIGVLLCYLSQSYPMYLVGLIVCTFFVSHDMQVVYILEAAPEKYRTTFYGTTKCIGTLGLVLVPLFRDIFMGNDPTKWRSVFIIPVFIALAVMLLAWIFARETDVYLTRRIAYLEKPEEPRTRQTKKANNKAGIGGALKYIFKGGRDLKWLFIGTIIFYLGIMGFSAYYESIMTSSGMSTEQVTDALYVYPFVFAAVIFLCGFLGDLIGRKTTACLMGLISVVTFVLFVAACKQGWAPVIVGIFYALYLGCFYTAGDYLTIMGAEKAPTEMRASVTAAFSLGILVSTLVGTILTIVLLASNIAIEKTCMIIAIPSVLIGVVIMLLKVKETKGVKLENIQAAE